MFRISIRINFFSCIDSIYTRTALLLLAAPLLHIQLNSASFDYVNTTVLNTGICDILSHKIHFMARWIYCSVWMCVSIDRGDLFLHLWCVRATSIRTTEVHLARINAC